MRSVITRVFPVPAPATTSRGPSPCSTAARCSGFSGNASANISICELIFVQGILAGLQAANKKRIGSKEMGKIAPNAVVCGLITRNKRPRLPSAAENS